MTRFKTLATLGLALLTCLPAFSQEIEEVKKPQPYTFITLQGGAQETFTNCSFDKLVTPIGAFSVGRFFTPAVGGRIGVQGWKNKSGYRFGGVDETFKFNYATTNIDLMFNLSNMICPKRAHTFNVILLGGVGLAYVWDNDGQKEIAAKHGFSEPLAWDDERITHNFRVGLQFDIDVARWLAVNLEVDANNMHDRFNAKTNGRGDWQVAALAGLTFKIGRKKAAPAPVPVKPAPAPQPAPAPEPKPEPKPEPTPAPKAKENLRESVFFAIAQYEPKAGEEAKVARIADWLKKHPSANVTLTGYADKNTGTAEINRKLSDQRASTIANMLIKKYGIDASRIKTDFKGDTVQPFAENDDNRVTIAIAAE